MKSAKQLLAFGLIGLSFVWADCAHGEIVLKPEHSKNRLAGVKIVTFSNDILTLKAEQKTNSFIVLKTDQPVEIRSTSNAKAKLIPGWDGTLGYSLYGLQLQIPRPGSVVVKLKAVQPPAKPVETTDDEIAAFAKKLAERLSRFSDEPTEFQKWQKNYRAKLCGWLMNGSMPKRVLLEAKVLETWDYDKFTLRKVKYRSQKDRTNVALLSLPKTVKKAPLLLALHGHEAEWGQADTGAFTMGHDDDFCAYFAERGWAVLQPATMNHTLQHPGWTLQGEWTWDAMVALDYAITVPEIDSASIAVCGLSTGGHLAMNVLALDERVKAGVVGCILSTWNHYRRFRIPPHCDCGIVAQLGPNLEQCDWAALAAPKPVQFHHGYKDASFCPGASPELLDLRWNTGIMPIDEYEKMFQEIKRAYSITHRPSQVMTHFHQMEHQIDNEAAFKWLTKWIGVPIEPI